MPRRHPTSAAACSDLSRLRPPVSTDGRRRRALDARPRPPPREDRQRGHARDDAALEPGDPPTRLNVRVIGVVDAGRVYSDERRTLLPPIRFGVAVARHFWRHGSDYDVVHMASFPVLPPPRCERAAPTQRLSARRELDRGLDEGVLAPIRRPCDRDRRMGRADERAFGFPHDAYCISRMHADAPGRRGLPREARSVLPGLYAGPVEPTPATRRGSEARRVRRPRRPREARRPPRACVRCSRASGFPISGSSSTATGPSSDRIARHRRGGRASTARSTCSASDRRSEIDAAMARAACLATASEREGYGLVVVEAAAHGTPSVIVAGAENAAGRTRRGRRERRRGAGRHCCRALRRRS